MSPTEPLGIARSQPSFRTPIWNKQGQEKPVEVFGQKAARGLVIDDQTDIVELLSRFLRGHGYAMEKVSDGISASRKLNDTLYDFIICDIKIPGKDGMDLYQELVQRGSPNAENFIFMTGDRMSPVIYEFLKSARRPFLSKPFELEDLRKLIQELMTTPAAGVF